MELILLETLIAIVAILLKLFLHLILGLNMYDDAFLLALKQVALLAMFNDWVLLGIYWIYKFF